jgi:protein-disulfide isomerase
MSFQNNREINTKSYMKNTTPLVFMLTGLILGTGAVTGSSEESQSDQDTKSLRGEIEGIKKSQEAIQKDLQEIKKLLLSQQAQPPSPAIGALVSVEGEPFKGEKNAKLTLIEFSDYQCPFCGRHVRDTVPQLEKEYISTGKIKYVFRDNPLPFHKDAPKAAEAAYCAGEQGKFWEMHDLMYSNQGKLSLTNLPTHAVALGLDAAKFQACLDSGKFADPIKNDAAEAAKLGLTGTPSFLLGVTTPNDGKIKVVKVIKGAQKFDNFKAAIDEILSPPKP